MRGFDTKHTGGEGDRKEKWEEERKSREEARCTEKEGLKVASLQTGPLSGELGAVRQCP